MKGNTMMYGTMAYVVQEGNVLMLKKGIRPNDPNSGYHALPGGKLEHFEKGIEQIHGRLASVIRETFGETGVSIIDTRLRGTVLFDNYEREFSNWGNPKDYLVGVYSAKPFNLKLKGSEEGIPLWVPKSKIRDLPKNSGDDLIYEGLDDGRDFSGVIKHKGKEVDYNGSWVDFFDGHGLI